MRSIKEGEVGIRRNYRLLFQSQLFSLFLCSSFNCTYSRCLNTIRSLEFNSPRTLEFKLVEAAVVDRISSTSSVTFSELFVPRSDSIISSMISANLSIFKIHLSTFFLFELVERAFRKIDNRPD